MTGPRASAYPLRWSSHAARHRRPGRTLSSAQGNPALTSSTQGPISWKEEVKPPVTQVTPYNGLLGQIGPLNASRD